MTSPDVVRLCTDARIRPILVVDEAHHLRPYVLEDLRLFTNYQMDYSGKCFDRPLGKA